MIDQLRKWIAEQQASNAEDVNVRSPSIKAHAEGFGAALLRLDQWLTDHVTRAPAHAIGFRCRCDGAAHSVTRTDQAGGVMLVTTSCRCGRPLTVSIEIASSIEHAAKAAGERRRR